MQRKPIFGTNTKRWYHHHSNIGECVVGDDCVLHSHIWIGDGVVVGNRVKIQAFTFIPSGVTIEDDVFLGPRVTFTNDREPPSPEWQRTVVKNRASIGAGTIILPGVTVGEGALIGAGSVVTKDVPAGEVWVGNPARYLRRRES